MSKRGAGILVGALLALTGGCADAGSDDAASSASSGTTSTRPRTPTTAPRSTTTTTTTPEDAVRAAYLAYWVMLDRLLAVPDPDDPEIERRMVEPGLSDLRQLLAKRRRDGTTAEIPSRDLNHHELTRVLVTGDEAAIEDCFLDGGIDVRADGSRNADVVTKRLSVLMQRVDGVWRVARSDRVARDPGVARCDA